MCAEGDSIVSQVPLVSVHSNVKCSHVSHICIFFFKSIFFPLFQHEAVSCREHNLFCKFYAPQSVPLSHQQTVTRKLPSERLNIMTGKFDAACKKRMANCLPPDKDLNENKT